MLKHFLVKYQQANLICHTVTINIKFAYAIGLTFSHFFFYQWKVKFIHGNHLHKEQSCQNTVNREPYLIGLTFSTKFFKKRLYVPSDSPIHFFILSYHFAFQHLCIRQYNCRRIQNRHHSEFYVHLCCQHE